MNLRLLSFYLSVLAIIVISFFFYSSNFYPLLNSDDALNILMAHYYKLPQDLYCWGQDRGGTLIPLVSQVFIKLFGFSALTSVSFSNYIVLILGYIGFSSIIKSDFYKLIFAIIWFLPFQMFIDIVRFPIGMEYSLIGFSVFLINRVQKCNPGHHFKKHLLLISTIVMLILSVWVSDMAIVTIGILMTILVVYNYFEKGSLVINWTIFIYAVSGFILCFLSIKLAKSYAPVKTVNYLSINHYEQIKTAFIILKKSFIEVILFKTREIFVSIYFILVIGFISFIIVYTLKKKVVFELFLNKWIAFFFFDFVIIFSVLMVSSWVLANGMGRWYFVASYISFALASLLTLDYLEKFKRALLFKYLVLLIALVGAISPIYSMKYIRPKTLTPMVDVVGEFKQLGEIGIIAEFWNSYITSCPDPELIKATPYDLSGAIRKKEIVDMVFQKRNLYVIRDMWMKSFPDTLEQFGHVLLKDGKPFRLGGCEVCKYNWVRTELKQSAYQLPE